MAHPSPVQKSTPLPALASGVGPRSDNTTWLSDRAAISSAPESIALPLAAVPSRWARVKPLITIALVVIVGSLFDPRFVTRRTCSGQSPGGLSLPSFSAPADLDADVLARRVSLFASELGLPPLTLLAADFGDEGQVFMAPALALSTDAFVASLGPDLVDAFDLVPWSAIAGSAVELPCAVVFELVSAFAGYTLPVGQPWNLPSTSEIDWGPRSDPVDLSNAVGWAGIVAVTRQSEVALGAAFAAVPSSDPHFTYLASCALQVLAEHRPSLSDVPAYLRRSGDPLVHRDTAWLPFSNRFDPTPTLPVPMAVQPSPAYRPLSFADILVPDALSLIVDWLRVEHSNMLAIAAFGPSVRRVPNAVRSLGLGMAVEPHGSLVIGQDQFLPLARGVVWDCRGFSSGLPAVPMDFSVAPSSDLNDVFIREALLDWPDQELVGFLINGVQFKANLPLQFVFMPHLSSISLAWSSVQSEILRLTQLGYNDLHHVIPFAPCRFVPQGFTPRKLEPTRFRRTSDGGAPRVAVLDAAGVPAVALNAGINLHAFLDDGPLDVPLSDDSSDESSSLHSRRQDSQQRARKWPAREVKPHLVDKALDDCILRDAAAIFHDPINGWTDDFADYFNQIPLSLSEYWTACFVWSSSLPELSVNLNEFGVPLTVVSERRLGFGVSVSSNIAQRFSEAIVAVFRSRFDVEESALFARMLDPLTGVCAPYDFRDGLTVAADGWSDVCRWIDKRRRLSDATGRNQLRRYSVHILRTTQCLQSWGMMRSCVLCVSGMMSPRTSACAWPLPENARSARAFLGSVLISTCLLES